MLAKYVFTIGSESYVGYVYDANGNANALSAQILCTRVEDDPLIADNANLAGKVFAINLQAAQDVSDIANAGALVPVINTDAALISFKQENYMSVDTIAGDILVNGVGIGTVAGLNAVLQTDSFDNLNVTEVSASPGGIDITLSNGTTSKIFHADYAATYSAGSNIVLTHTASEDRLTLSLGTTQALDVSTSENQKAFSVAMKKALTAHQSSAFIVHRC